MRRRNDGDRVRALLVREPTGPGVLETDGLAFSPARVDVVIDVHAVGVTFPDLLLTQGRYPVKTDPPLAPGLEAAGE
ncbi:hypothetical protein ABZ215_40420 [Amycolatopsis sp. NPDC006131]|uniref:alcohol dehydrogenase catalytic domain-containing protein n=1 Tax=Amycolatopsis sp. NPDC006131 TaxID=3156731 RepID=UPI0033A2F5BB